MRKYVVTNATLIFLGFIAALALSEMMLRLYNPLSFEVKGDQIELRVSQSWDIDQINPELSERVSHVHNTIGFRGEEPPENFSESVTVIVVGGSTVHELALDEDQTWVSLLGHRLETKFRHLWINNAGLDGHSTFGHIILLKEHLSILKPDVIVYLIGVNDVSRDSTSHSEVIPDSLVKPGERIIKRLADRMEIVALPLNIYRTIKSPDSLVHQHDFDLTKVGKRFLTDDSKLDRIELIRRTYLKGYSDRVNRLIEETQSMGIVPVLITQPSLYGYFKDPISGMDLSLAAVGDFNGGLAWDILELYNDETRRIGASQSVLVIDLANSMPHSSEYYYDWIHFNIKGAELVNDIVYEELCDYLGSKFSENLIENCG